MKLTDRIVLGLSAGIAAAGGIGTATGILRRSHRPEIAGDAASYVVFLLPYLLMAALAHYVRTQRVVSRVLLFGIAASSCWVVWFWHQEDWSPENAFIVPILFFSQMLFIGLLAAYAWAQRLWARSKTGQPVFRKFSRIDGALLAVLVLTYVPLSVWGGMHQWASGLADTLPALMFGFGMVLVIYESIKLCSPAIVPVISGLVPLVTIGPGLAFYPEDSSTLLPVMAACYLFGLLTSSGCWAIWRRSRVSPAEWAFWLGVHGLFCAPLSVGAIVCGHVASRRAQQSGKLRSVRVRIALVLGYSVLALLIAGIAVVGYAAA